MAAKSEEIAPTADSYEEARFFLTKKGKLRMEQLLTNPDYKPFVDGIRRVKSRFSKYSLNDLLYYVYTRHPAMTTESEIKEKVFAGVIVAKDLSSIAITFHGATLVGALAAYHKYGDRTEITDRSLTETKEALDALQAYLARGVAEAVRPTIERILADATSRDGTVEDLKADAV